MRRFLIVDPDPAIMESMREILDAQSIGAVRCLSAAAAIDMIQSDHSLAVWTTVRLPDASCVELVRRIRQQGDVIPVLIMTDAFASSMKTALQGIGAGADLLLQKPLVSSEIMTAIRLSGRDVSDCYGAEPDLTLVATRCEAVRRWIRLVAGGIGSDPHVKTTSDWARGVNMSKATLDNRCRAVGVTTKQSLDLIRVARGVLEASQLGCALELALDADPRTVRRMLANCRNDKGLLPINFLDFCSRQRFIQVPVLKNALRASLGIQ